MMIRRPWPCQPECWPGGKNYPIRHSHDPAGVEWGWEAEGGIEIFLNYKTVQQFSSFVKNLIYQKMKASIIQFAE